LPDDQLAAHAQIHNFKNNIIVSNIHYEIFCVIDISMKKKVEVYFSTGNKGVYSEKVNCSGLKAQSPLGHLTPFIAGPILH